MRELEFNPRLLERLVYARLRRPGVIDLLRLAQWQERFARFARLAGLNEWLLQRVLSLAASSGESMVWRTAPDEASVILAPEIQATLLQMHRSFTTHQAGNTVSITHTTSLTSNEQTYLTLSEGSPEQAQLPEQLDLRSSREPSHLDSQSRVIERVSTTQRSQETTREQLVYTVVTTPERSSAAHAGPAPSSSASTSAPISAPTSASTLAPTSPALLPTRVLETHERSLPPHDSVRHTGSSREAGPADLPFALAKGSKASAQASIVESVLLRVREHTPDVSAALPALVLRKSMAATEVHAHSPRLSDNASTFGTEGAAAVARSFAQMNENIPAGTNTVSAPQRAALDIEQLSQQLESRVMRSLKHQSDNDAIRRGRRSWA